MLSNRKLTYNQVYVDSQKRLPQSESSSDCKNSNERKLRNTPEHRYVCNG